MGFLHLMVHSEGNEWMESSYTNIYNIQDIRYILKEDYLYTIANKFRKLKVIIYYSSSAGTMHTI